MGKTGAKWTLRRYAEESRSLGNAALLTAPIVLSYEVGLLLLGDRAVRNAADALIDQGLMAFGRPVALAVNLMVLGAFIAFAVTTGTRKATPIGLFIPAVLEGALYACILIPALMAVSRRMIAAPGAVEPLEGIVLSLGAGFYEELVFRLMAVGGAYLVLQRLGVRAELATIGLLLLSGLAFSWFHHVGPGAEPLVARVFVMRAIAGVLLGGLFILRGFGIVCYTHVIYDLICLLSG
jgi:hypothetical protein